MAKAKNKTVENNLSVSAFLNSVEDDQKRKDAKALLKLFKEVTGLKPKMWGTSIVGFGSYHYVYESGREGDMPMTGFSPRKQNMTLYIMGGFTDYEALLSTIGKHKTGKSCFYFKKLEDIDQEVLTKMIKKSIVHVKKKYKPS